MRPSLAFAFLAAASAAAASAQDGVRHAEGRTIVLGPAQAAMPASATRDIPAPPRAIGTPDLSPQPVPPLPAGDASRPQPDSPPTSLRLAGGPGLPCDERSYTASIVKPAGASVHTVGEPSVALAGTTTGDSDTAFYTGNQFAAVSLDGGQTWTHVNPYTRFPALDGGFCCDQRTLYVPSRDITVWYLQYWPSATTNKGSIRLAVSVGRTGLRNDVWHSFVFDPQMFGFPAGYWFDFPDVAHSEDHLWLSVNVITPTPWMNVDSLVLKMPLDEVKVSGGTINATFWTRGTTLGPGRNYRFAQGATDTMYFGSHQSTSSIRIFRNPDASAVLTFEDRAVATWSDTDPTYVSVLGNSTNWADRAVPFIKGAYANAREYGFLWHSGTHAGRPQPYVRIARFSTVDHSLLGEEDIWNPVLAWLYPAAATNSAGHIGCVLAAGGAPQKPVATLLIVDDCRPTFAGPPIVGFAFSTHDPTYAGWGDYFSMQRHPARTLSFVTSGLAMSGGSQTTDQGPRYMHFGRQRDELAWTTVSVHATGTQGLPLDVPVGVSPVDQLGKSQITTPGYASYVAAAGFTLTAPATHVAGGKTWEFRHWRHKLTPIDAWTTLPPGQLTLSNAQIGQRDDFAEAVYAERVTGAVAPYGAGCAGSNALVPDHFTLATPEVGQVLTYEVKDVFGATSAALFIGTSNTLWNGIPLPLGLGLIGADPSCAVLAAGTFTPGFAVDAAGAGSAALRFPGSTSLVGTHVYTQVVVVDPFVAASMKLIVSNGLDAVLGGLR
jgi:hypothetical protein